MRWTSWLGLTITHLLAVVAGFISAIYLLPLVIAPESPYESDMAMQITQVDYHGQFKRDLKGSDVLHWGEGRLVIGNDLIAFDGKISPGSDYKLYLSPIFVETEEAFLARKDDMLLVGDVDTFDRFLMHTSADTDWQAYNSVVIWSDAFNQFITAAQFRE